MNEVEKLIEEKRHLLDKIYKIDSKIENLTKSDNLGFQEGKYYALEDHDATYYFRYEKSKNNGFIRDGEIWIRNVLVQREFRIKSAFKLDELVTFDVTQCAMDSNCIKEITKEQYDQIVTDFISSLQKLIINEKVDNRCWYIIGDGNNLVRLPENDYQVLTTTKKVHTIYKGTREEVDNYYEKCLKA